MRSTRVTMVAGLFGAAVVWIILMWFVSIASASLRGRVGTEPYDDGSVKAKITNVDRDDDFTITVSLAVTDANGNKLERALDESAIDLYEDGELILSYKEFLPAGKANVRVAVVLDHTTTMGQANKIVFAREAAEALFMLLDDKDFVSLYFFNDPLLQSKRDEQLPLKAFDRAALVKAMRALWLESPRQIRDGTPLSRATQRAVEGMANIKGRRAVIVLTDGMETGEPEQIEANKQALIARCQELKVPLYTISMASGFQDQAMMREMAEKTNGKFYAAPKPEELKRIFEEIGRSLQDEYTLIYDSPNTAQDGNARQVKVVVRNGPVGTTADGRYSVPGVLGGTGGRRTASAGVGTLLLVCVTLGGLLALLFTMPQLLRGRSNGAEPRSAEPAPAPASPAMKAAPRPGLPNKRPPPK